MVECHLAKVDVEGSNPFSRSTLSVPGPYQFLCHISRIAKIRVGYRSVLRGSGPGIFPTSRCTLPT